MTELKDIELLERKIALHHRELSEMQEAYLVERGWIAIGDDYLDRVYRKSDGFISLDLDHAMEHEAELQEQT